MSHLTAICRALDCVEENLTEAITVADMAAAASYSLFHFSRTFNRVVHHTPYDYLMRRRLSESARQLVETDRKIIDIALDYQFNNPETYSRAFKRMFGVQPSRWKEHQGPGERLLIRRLTREYLQHINQPGCLRPVLKELDALRLVGVMTVVDGGPEPISRLWEVLARELQRAGGTLGASGAYGIIWYPEGWAARGSLYMAAVEAQPLLEGAGSALVTKTIGPLRCARFVHRGSRQDVRHALDYIYTTWLPKSGERLISPMEIEHYAAHWEGYQDGETKSEWELYIPIA